MEGFDIGHHKSAHNSHGTYFLSLRAMTNTKIIVCALFYVIMSDKTPCNLMSPFSNDFFY